MNINNELSYNNQVAFTNYNHQSSINILPNSVVSHVFDYLSHATLLASTSLLNQKFRRLSIQAICHKKFNLISDFVCFSVNKMDKKIYKKEINELLSIKNNQKIYGLIDLSEINFSFKEIKESIINIIKNLEAEDLKNLQNPCNNPSDFAQLIFYLAPTYKRIEEIIKENDYNKSNHLADVISHSLINAHIDKAIEVVEFITEKSLKIQTFELIIKELLTNEKIDQLIKITYSLISIIENQDYAPILLSIIKKLINTENIDLALEMIDELFPNYFSLVDKNKAFLLITIALIQRNAIAQAKNIINKMEIDDRNEALDCIFKMFLFQNDDIEQAQLIYNEMQNSDCKKKCGLNLAEKLVKIGHFEQALVIINAIPREIIKHEEIIDLKNKVLASIAELLIKKDNLDQAQEIVKNIESYHLKNETISLIIDQLIKKSNYGKIEGFFNKGYTDKYLGIFTVNKLIKNGNITEAEKIAKLVNDKEVTHLIAIELAKKFDANRALKLVCPWPNQDFENRTFLAIIRSFAEEGDIYQARKLSNRLNKSSDKELALRYIIKGLIKKEQFERAQETAYEFSNLYAISHALHDIIRELLDKNKIDQAKEIASTIVNKEIRNNALQDIANTVSQKLNQKVL